MEKRETQSSTPERDSQLTEVTEQRREESANVCIVKGGARSARKREEKWWAQKRARIREREREERV